MTHGPQDPQRPDGGPVSLARATGCGLCATCTGGVPARPEFTQPRDIERRQNRKAATSRALINAAIIEYGAKCRVDGTGSAVQAAWDACMAELDEQMGNK